MSAYLFRLFLQLVYRFDIVFFISNPFLVSRGLTGPLQDISILRVSPSPIKALGHKALLQLCQQRVPHWRCIAMEPAW